MLEMLHRSSGAWVFKKKKKSKIELTIVFKLFVAFDAVSEYFLFDRWLKFKWKT